MWFAVTIDSRNAKCFDLISLCFLHKVHQEDKKVTLKNVMERNAG
jgi:hypothetical protein